VFIVGMDVDDRSACLGAGQRLIDQLVHTNGDLRLALARPPAIKCDFKPGFILHDFDSMRVTVTGMASRGTSVEFRPTIGRILDPGELVAHFPVPDVPFTAMGSTSRLSFSASCRVPVFKAMRRITS